ncbi:MAG: cation-translocating P-type ATPase [Ruminococcaceae bacterium]|nr:cation-translocating P-type ATPase [Oscillospiraceae bacterium]
MKPTYQLSRDELLTNVDVTQGLSAEQAADILQKNGPNALSEGKKKSVLSVFLGQFADLLVIILIVAAIVSMLSGNVESTIVIFAVILMNAVLGTVQYVKAEKSLESLKALSSPRAKVLRDGVKQEIPSSEVVEGDLLLLEAGDMIAADGRIVECASLQVNESSLTGESTNVDKADTEISADVPLGDRINMVYSGTLVTYGRAVVLVTATGMNTEMGHIADLMNATKEKKTPLQVSLDGFSKKLAFGIMAICALVFVLRLWQGYGQEGILLDSLMFAVALAVAAIPEALSSIVTIVQAMGTRKMAEDNAIMKELKAVESLGCVSVICSDKTGTLTQNKMTVQDIYADGRCMNPENMTRNSPAQSLLLYTAVLDNDASVDGDKTVGDPTEACLVTMAQRASVGDVEELRRQHPRLSELPFDSDRKLMSCQCEIQGKRIMMTKGAPDVLLARCTSIAMGDTVRPINDTDRAAIMAQNDAFSENGLRVLCFACKEHEKALTAEDEQALMFLGLVSMVDPPRPESIGAVADAISAGIKPIMITGDHKVTAKAIAQQIGICTEDGIAVTGPQLDAMSDEELDEQLEQIAVYARVSPENKIRIVDAWQRKGHIVAMTGDGVNDAPALKKADIGVAMGITGTEVSKDAASMILSDDNFATIIKAVEGGRNVYRNIINAIQFLLSGNLAAIFVVLICTFATLPTPFAPVHLLFINLLTDSLPALAIGMEPSDRTLLKKKPRPANEGIFTKKFTVSLLAYGVLIAAVTMTAFLMGYRTDAATASTMAFATLTLARLFHGFNCRSERSMASVGIRTNLWSIGAFAAGVLLLAAVLFLPFLHGVFEVAAIGAQQVLTVFLLAFAPTALVQLVRMVRELKKDVKNS